MKQTKLANLSQTHQGGEDTNKIKNEREVTTDTTEIHWILKEYYIKIYARKLNNLCQQEVENLSRPIKSERIELVIKKLPETKVQDQMDSQVILLHILKKIN